MSKNVKLKSLLEGYAWERNSRDFGKPLPTLEDIQKAHQAKTLAEAAPVKLKLGQMYQVLDLGINEWNDEYLIQTLENICSKHLKALEEIIFSL